MLRRLLIENYLLVRRVELEFSDGLTVLTGETGAGKSMLLGALDVLLGERFPRNAVPQDAERAVIEGEFELAAIRSPIDALLEENSDNKRLRLRREITRQGRSRSWLNDRPLSQDTLPALREALADFHGQREHQSLFKPSRQLDFLDAYAGTRDLARIVASLYATRIEQKRLLEKTTMALVAHQKDRALLEYQLEEIERLGLKSGEEETLEARLTKLESAEKLAVEASHLLALLSEADPSLVTLSGQAKTIATGISKTDRDLLQVADELSNVTSRLKDVAEQVRHYLDGLAFDDDDLIRLRERRSILWELRRRHGLTVEQILARAGEFKHTLEQGKELEDRCTKLDAELHQTDDQLIMAARDLSGKRRTAATAFGVQVTETMKPLGFTHPQFLVSMESLPEPLDAERIQEEGADRADFLFSANPGGKPVPIVETASGGESSRVTLAIKTVLSEKAEYPLMIYDEIDLGISGRVADQVGKALVQLAHRHQLLVITHLPQIASRADHHLAVRKKTRETHAETTAHFLSDEERVEAIAALIAGAKVTEKSLASAGELLRQNGKLKTLSGQRG